MCCVDVCRRSVICNHSLTSQLSQTITVCLSFTIVSYNPCIVFSVCASNTRSVLLFWTSIHPTLARGQCTWMLNQPYIRVALRDCALSFIHLYLHLHLHLLISVQTPGVAIPYSIARCKETDQLHVIFVRFI